MSHPAVPSADQPEERTAQEAADASWTVVVLTEEALGEIDAGNIAALHEGESVRHVVVVPADTERNLLADVLDHLSLGELRAALEEVRAGKPDPQRARADAETALARSVAELRSLGLAAEGRTSGDDPMPVVRELLLEEEDARELVVVTRPHAVEDTFHTDWASRARDTLGVPVLHLYAGTMRLG
ncbi:hypothetical protein MO973_29535 [Paenibacillus sp. TRM 82003]|uniref:hypothetical protein n=1 Tax=Kineococcus sp. TRM81007 TaxID=2925831 RepID=UPI001F583AF7|nr:hypothetical protein [Kineococcus sp. TRM81007]MCI2238952.1 hypothetical protein [Kineococcus sp. TRM81007]MCI3924371.1 hypothetical protein [Paenibacillus sp. TRM 82003]